MLFPNPQFSVRFSHKLSTCVLRENLPSRLSSELRVTRHQTHALFAFYVQISLLTPNLLMCVGGCVCVLLLLMLLLCMCAPVCVRGWVLTWTHEPMWQKNPLLYPVNLCVRNPNHTVWLWSLSPWIPGSVLANLSLADLTGINQGSTCQDLLCWSNGSQSSAPRLYLCSIVSKALKNWVDFSKAPNQCEAFYNMCRTPRVKMVMCWFHVHRSCRESQEEGSGGGGSTEPLGCLTLSKLSVSGL